MASNDSFQETCERKSEDGHQIELLQKLLMVCDAVQVRGGFDATIEEYSLPRNIRRLPFFHYTIITEMAMKPDIINQRVTRTVKEHMGHIEHTVCPDKVNGKNTKTHSFFIVSPMGLYNLLLELMKCTGETKDALSILYKASISKSTTREELKPTARLCTRFQAGAYILGSASDLDLAENMNWKQMEKGLTRNFGKSIKSDTDAAALRKAQKTLMDAARKISSSNPPLEKGTNPPQDSSPLRGSTKRQRPSEIEDDVQRDTFSRLVRPRSGGDDSGNISEKNAFDGSPASVLPQPTCQGIPAPVSLPGFHGILPRRPDNGVQHDALRLVQSERKGSVIDMSSGQGYNNAIFAVFPDSVLTQPTCQGIPAAEFFPGFNGLLDDGTLQNSTPGTPLLVNNNQDGFFMESYDPFAEANPFRFDNDENRSL